MTGLRFERMLPDEFDPAVCLDYLERSPLECLYEADPRGVNRLLRLDGRLVLIRFDWSAPGRLGIERLAGDSLLEEDGPELLRYAAEWFDLDRDLRPFYRMAAEDALLGPLAERFYGLRLIGVPDLFEALCWAIVGQQVNLTFAYTLKKRLAEAYGEALQWNGRTYRLFPGPERMAAAEGEELTGLQLTRNKARAIRETAEWLASGRISRERLAGLSGEEAERELTAIRGVGPWTAQYVRMRCLRDLTAVPYGDVGLQNAVKALTGMDRKPTLPELRELFVRWPGWESYAVFYLWRALY